MKSMSEHGCDVRSSAPWPSGGARVPSCIPDCSAELRAHAAVHRFAPAPAAQESDSAVVLVGSNGTLRKEGSTFEPCLVALPLWRRPLFPGQQQIIQAPPSAVLGHTAVPCPERPDVSADCNRRSLRNLSLSGKYLGPTCGETAAAWPSSCSQQTSPPLEYRRRRMPQKQRVGPRAFPHIFAVTRSDGSMPSAQPCAVVSGVRCVAPRRGAKPLAVADSRP